MDQQIEHQIEHQIEQKLENQPDQQLSFEEAIASLESMVAELESDDLPLQSAMNTFERSQALIQHCARQLTQAEQKVQVLVRQLDAEGLNYELEDFEDDDDED